MRREVFCWTLLSPICAVGNVHLVTAAVTIQLHIQKALMAMKRLCTKLCIRWTLEEKTVAFSGVCLVE